MYYNSAVYVTLLYNKNGAGMYVMVMHRVIAGSDSGSNSCVCMSVHELGHISTINPYESGVDKTSPSIIS